MSAHEAARNIKSLDPVWDRIRTEAEEITRLDTSLGGFIFSSDRCRVLAILCIADFYGGDEFSLILPGAREADALEVAGDLEGRHDMAQVLGERCAQRGEAERSSPGKRAASRPSTFPAASG